MKYKGVEVKRKPWYMRHIYCWRSHGVAQLGKIYLNDKFLKEFKSGKFPFDLETLLIHEKTHVDRFTKKGKIKCELIYWFAPKFRFEEELAATKEEMKFYKKKNKKYDFKERAQHLSGIGYLWCASYENAYNRLEKMWKEV